MSKPSQGTSGPSGYAGLRPAASPLLGGSYVVSQPPSTHTSPEQSVANQIRKLTHTVENLLVAHNESSVTKEQMDSLLKGLDRLGLGADDGDAVHKPQSIRSNALLLSLGQVKDKLKDASNRLENMGHTENNEDGRVMSELIDNIGNAVNDCQSIVLAANAPGELPPPAPRVCFGRDGLIEEIVGLAENLEPMALIGAGGIGKTSIALKVLHDNRAKQRFGDNRRFIRCDQFPATLPHFLSRLSKVTGAGVENPENLTALLPFLSSNKILIVLDNAESILDPEGTDAQDIYASVEELCQLDTICVCITSRISIIPPGCKMFEIPTLSMDAAREVFYRLYSSRRRSDLVDGVLAQLEFHPLSVALLATVGQQSRWSVERLIKEWEGRRTDTLRTGHRTSLGATIELSLASPTFKELGPDARGLLGVVAFYPQGVDENNIEWLFPTTSDRTRILDVFCMLSLTHRSNGFITMLAPLRDHLRLKDPISSPLLCATKDRYFARISVKLNPNLPGFGDLRWIRSEDVNVEHLLDVFTSIDPDWDDIWCACVHFIRHLALHKPRQTVLRKKIERLPDDHRFKSECLVELAVLYQMIGNHAELALLLNRALKFERERGNNLWVALILRGLSNINWASGHRKEGIDQAREALDIFERLGGTVGRASCLSYLALLLLEEDGQLGAAEEAALESITLLPEKGQEYQLYMSHSNLGGIYQAKGEREKAIYHYELALGIASTSNWGPLLFSLHTDLATLFVEEAGFDEAQVHVEQAKSHAHDNTFTMGAAALLQAVIWGRQGRFEDALSEALHAQEIFEKFGNLECLEASCAFQREIEEATNRLPPSGEPDSNAHGASSSSSANLPHDPDYASKRSPLS